MPNTNWTNETTPAGAGWSDAGTPANATWSDAASVSSASWTPNTDFFSATTYDASTVTYDSTTTYYNGYDSSGSTEEDVEFAAWTTESVPSRANWADPSLITTRNLTTSGDSVDATSFATAAVTPKANHLILAWVYTIAATTPTTPTASGNGLTWVEVATVLDSDSLRRLTLFRALGTAPTAGSLTFDFASQTQTGCVWSVAEFSGVDTGGTNGSSAIVQYDTEASVGTVSSLTATLAAFTSTSNATAGGFGYPLNNGNGTSGTGFAELGERFQGGPNQAIYTEFRGDTDTTVDISIGASSVPIVGIAVEIKTALL